MNKLSADVAIDGGINANDVAHSNSLENLGTKLPISDRLYNTDLAPTKRAGRSWSSYNIFTLWANDVHSLGNYSFAIGLFALGLGAWQILLSIFLGAVFLFLLLNLSGFMGEKTGVPFPVMSRIAFGIHGAQVPAVIRGGVPLSGSVFRRTLPVSFSGSCLWLFSRACMLLMSIQCWALPRYDG